MNDFKWPLTDSVPLDAAPCSVAPDSGLCISRPWRTTWIRGHVDFKILCVLPSKTRCLTSPCPFFLTCSPAPLHTPSFSCGFPELLSCYESSSVLVLELVPPPKGRWGKDHPRYVVICLYIIPIYTTQVCWKAANLHPNQIISTASLSIGIHLLCKHQGTDVQHLKVRLLIIFYVYGCFAGMSV